MIFSRRAAPGGSGTNFSFSPRNFLVTFFIGPFNRRASFAFRSGHKFIVKNGKGHPLTQGMLRTFILLSLMAGASFARHDVLQLSVAKAISHPDFKARFGTKMKFMFGGKPDTTILRTFGEFQTNRKINAFGQSDESACQEAFTNAMLVMKARANREGANAIINIFSNYKKNRLDTGAIYECGAGAMVAGVALVGELVVMGEAPTATPPEAKPAPAATPAAKSNEI
jgi:uncharacterized protein YbjQ (UPF0145 family)